MDSPTLGKLLGRYEFKDATSDKFWGITYDHKSANYVTSWGKNGYPAQGTRNGLTGKEALKKVQEKISKGYRKVGDAVEAGDEPVKSEREMAIGRIEKKRAEKRKASEFMDELKKLQEFL